MAEPIRMPFEADSGGCGSRELRLQLDGGPKPSRKRGSFWREVAAYCAVYGRFTVTPVSCAKTAKLIAMPFGAVDSNGPKEPDLAMRMGTFEGCPSHSSINIYTTAIV